MNIKSDELDKDTPVSMFKFKILLLVMTAMVITAFVILIVKPIKSKDSKKTPNIANNINSDDKEPRGKIPAELEKNLKPRGSEEKITVEVSDDTSSKPKNNETTEKLELSSQQLNDSFSELEQETSNLGKSSVDKLSSHDSINEFSIDLDNKGKVDIGKEIDLEIKKLESRIKNLETENETFLVRLNKFKEIKSSAESLLGDLNNKLKDINEDKELDKLIKAMETEYSKILKENIEFCRRTGIEKKILELENTTGSIEHKITELKMSLVEIISAKFNIATINTSGQYPILQNELIKENYIEYIKTKLDRYIDILLETNTIYARTHIIENQKMAISRELMNIIKYTKAINHILKQHPTLQKLEKILYKQKEDIETSSVRIYERFLLITGLRNIDTTIEKKSKNYMKLLKNLNSLKENVSVCENESITVTQNLVSGEKIYTNSQEKEKQFSLLTKMKELDNIISRNSALLNNVRESSINFSKLLTENVGLIKELERNLEINSVSAIKI